MDATLIPWIFAAIMTAGITFLLISIFFGDLDLDIDTDVDIDLDADSALHGIFGHHDTGDGHNLGCMAIAAFLTGFGSVGLIGSLAGWSVFFSLIAGLFFGLVFGRSAAAAIRYVIRQEYTDLITTDSLIGEFARITVNIPAGKTGEAMVEGKSISKYPVRSAGEDVAFKKGDNVEIIEVREGVLYVKKKRSQSPDDITG